MLYIRKICNLCIRTTPKDLLKNDEAKKFRETNGCLRSNKMMGSSILGVRRVWWSKYMVKNRG